MFSNIYRPHIFDDVIGQDATIKALKNYIKSNTLPSSIMLIGNSGSGKNTIANIIALTLNCENPIFDKDGMTHPCQQCSSCKDIIEERFHKDVLVYNGAEMKAEDISSLVDKFSYSPMQNNRIVIINELQRVSSLNKLLEVIEVPRKNTYFILTSTDTNRFRNSGLKDNKNQENAAMRGRGTYFQIKAVSSNLISNYLFSIIEKIDQEGKIPDSFIEEGIHIIAENAKGSVRQALNDFYTAINAECYDKKSIQELLGYEDEKQNIEYLLKILNKDVSIFEYLQECQDVQGFFFYTWKILNDFSIREIQNKTLKENWKEEIFLRNFYNRNLEEVLSIYHKTNAKCYGYFNPNIFMNELYFYFKNTITILQERNLIKKIKVPKNG